RLPSRHRRGHRQSALCRNPRRARQARHPLRRDLAVVDRADAEPGLPAAAAARARRHPGGHIGARRRCRPRRDAAAPGRQPGALSRAADRTHGALRGDDGAGDVSEANHIDYQVRWAIDPDAAALMGTDELRGNFLVETLFDPGRIALTYTHYDRMIVGGAMPLDTPLPLLAIKPTGTPSFLDRRELIAVNIGGPGVVGCGGERFEAATRDMVYLGMGAGEPVFSSADPDKPAKFYLLSAPAHAAHPSMVL